MALKPRELAPIWGLTIEQKWLVESLIPAESVIMLSGESGSGKSTFSLALAECVASGKDFLGYKTEQRPVLIVDRENGLTIYHERLKRLNIEENLDLMFWGLWSPEEPPGPAGQTILEFAKAEKPLIIFDSFVAFHPGSEQDADETRDYMDGFRRLAGTGATVLAIHHTGKGENTKEYRGSSDIKASLDVGLTLIAKRPLLQLLQLKPFKTREGVMEPLSITYGDDGFQLLDNDFVQPDEPAWKAVLAHVGQNPGQNQSEICGALIGQFSIPKIRKVLMAGELKGVLRVAKGQKNASFYHLGDEKNAQ